MKIKWMMIMIRCPISRKKTKNSKNHSRKGVKKEVALEYQQEDNLLVRAKDDLTNRVCLALSEIVHGWRIHKITFR